MIKYKTTDEYEKQWIGYRQIDNDAVGRRVVSYAGSIAYLLEERRSVGRNDIYHQTRLRAQLFHSLAVRRSHLLVHDIREDGVHFIDK